MNNINRVNYNYGIDCKNDVFITVTVTLCHNPAPPPLPTPPPLPSQKNYDRHTQKSC